MKRRRLRGSGGQHSRCSRKRPLTGARCGHAVFFPLSRSRRLGPTFAAATLAAKRIGRGGRLSCSERQCSKCHFCSVCHEEYFLPPVPHLLPYCCCLEHLPDVALYANSCPTRAQLLLPLLLPPCCSLPALSFCSLRLLLGHLHHAAGMLHANYCPPLVLPLLLLPSLLSPCSSPLRLTPCSSLPALSCCPCCPSLLPQVVAVYKDDGERGHHMQDYIPKEELAKFMAKTGDSRLQQQVRAFLPLFPSSAITTAAAKAPPACSQLRAAACMPPFQQRPSPIVWLRSVPVVAMSTAFLVGYIVGLGSTLNPVILQQPDDLLPSLDQSHPVATCAFVVLCLTPGRGREQHRCGQRGPQAAGEDGLAAGQGHRGQGRRPHRACGARRRRGGGRQ